MANFSASSQAQTEFVDLKVEIVRDEASDLYRNHGTFHDGDSGLDLFIIENQTIKAGETVLLKLGIKATAFKAGRNVSWLIMPRSSICKTPLRQSNSIGLIDSGYRGELMLPVDNIKNVDHTVKRGDRLAQAVAFSGEPLRLELVSKLNDTARGTGGFGSTGQTSESLAGTTTPSTRNSDGEEAPTEKSTDPPAAKKMKGTSDELVGGTATSGLLDENTAPVSV